LADLASESVIVFDLAGHIRYWNPASERLYGWPPTGMVGSLISELSSNAKLHSRQWSLLLQEGSWEGSVRRRTASGGHVATVVRQTVRCGADGRPRDIVEYGRLADTSLDETPARNIRSHHVTAASWELDLSRARSLLNTIEARMRWGAAADQTWPPGQADELLANTQIVDVNERVVQLVGGHVNRHQMIGEPVSAFWPLENRGILAELIAAVATDRSRNATRVRRLRSDGILRDPVVTVWRSEASERKDTVFVAVYRTADDDRSLWYLRASEERYRKLIHYLPTALLQVDASRVRKVLSQLKANGVTDLGAYLNDHPELVEYARNAVRVTEVNQKAVALFGGTAPADFIRSVRFLYAASPETLRRVMIARFEEQRNYSEIMKVRTVGGRLLDVQLSVTYLAPPEPLDVSLVGLEDITGRLCTERQLRQLEADFTHAARLSMLGELTTSIAHEVNQPLAAIVTNGETSLRWLSRDEPNLAKVEQLTARMVSNARRASDIVQRIRGLAMPHPPERILLDLDEVVEEALLFVRHELETKSIELSVRLSPGLSPVVGDRVQLQQVIVNLLVNGIQALTQGSGSVRRMELETGDNRDGTVFYSIRDNGPGIADENLDRVFDSFFTTKNAGMGIGLAICQSIVTAHGGSIAASNHPDGGAELRFSLPAQPIQRI
jgi:PAS domain S-box-containing protein